MIRYKCPCCRNYTIAHPGEYEICDICRWEDDWAQIIHPNLFGGANKDSLTEARKKYNTVNETLEDFNIKQKEEKINYSINIMLSKKYSPKALIVALTTLNWIPCIGNIVLFLEPKKKLSNPKYVTINEFDFNKFINTYGENDDIAISMTSTKKSSVVFLILNSEIHIKPFINIKTIDKDTKILNLNWYLKELTPFLTYIDITSIKCESTYSSQNTLYELDSWINLYNTSCKQSSFTV